MALSDIVNVTITATSVGVTQAGFGVPMIVSHTAAWAERTRQYTDITGVAVDFASTTPEYKKANAVFSQTPRVPKITIGRAANKPTQRRTITPTVANNTVYKIRVGTSAAGTVSFTSSGSATAANIVTGLIALVNAIAGITCTATGSTTLVLTGNTPGAYDEVEVGDVSLLSLVQDHADPGIAADLDAIKLADPTWYVLLLSYESSAMIAAAAAWAESNLRLYIAASQDSPIITTVLSGATDIAATLHTAAYKRTALLYHPASTYISASWAGRLLPYDPGSETWALKTLAGVTPTTLTTTQRTNALAKAANIYETIAGVNVTNSGTVADAEFIDVIRFIDWLTARIGERVFGQLASLVKIPYTDQGIAYIAQQVRATLADGFAVGGLASYAVSVPKASDANPSDKAARILRNVNFTGVLAGAVHTVAVNGTVSA